MTFGSKSTSSNSSSSTSTTTSSDHHEGGRGATCSLKKKRVQLGYPQLGLVVAICILLGIVVPSEFQVVPAPSSRQIQVAAVRYHDAYPYREPELQQPLPSTTSNGTSLSLHGTTTTTTTGGKPPSLQIAWLMSFPNSGTSYTSKLIRHVSLTRTASNYGNEERAAVGLSQAVFDDQPTGPFWQDMHIHPEYTLPQNYALTKTHCGGRCEMCGPKQSIETINSFRRYCLSGKGLMSVNGTEVFQKLTYGPDKVAKVIHVVRNPFDNVVSRFNLERHSGKRSAGIYPSTRQGFRDFCFKLNEAYANDHKSHLHDAKHVAMMKDVPCYADFFRYIEWHNLAFVTSSDLDLMTYVLHYDWFATRFNETLTELLDFLQLEYKAEPHPFIMGKVYRDYFTAEEQAAVKAVLKDTALQVTWQTIAQYFQD